MRKLYVDLGEKSYYIMIERGLIERVGQYARGKKIVVITDQNVDAHYGGIVMSSLTGEALKLVLPAGEETKSLKSLNRVYNFLLRSKITRSDLIIALGGGVIGDLAGFAAATVLRGVPFIQVPTSLLAQVDSSVGGKVAVNSRYGKNLIGAFYQPKLVLIDPDCLKTLDKRFFADGMAEVIKYGCIRDESLLAMLENEDILENLESVIERCCDIKRSIVETDEFDTGERMLLNFGHTIGHAVENYHNYSKYTHGEAVAIGMYNICLEGERLGFTQQGTAERIKRLLIKYNLPFRLDVGLCRLKDTIALDKKSQSDLINIIFLETAGKAIIKKMKKDELFA
jgi:3-dehydroquinate synthase